MKNKMTTCAILASLGTITMHLINKSIIELASINNLLNPAEGNYYEWRFGKIYYKKQGEGSPILLIHDLNAHSSGYEWKKAANILSEKHTVYSIDLLGCGRSDKPNITYTNFLYVQMINDFISNIIGEKTDVIATGESSSFVIMACNTGENNISRIAMVNPLSFVELTKGPSKRTKILKFLIEMPIIGTLLYNMLQTKDCIEDTFREKYFFNAGKIDDTMIKTYYEAAHTNHARSKYLFASIKGLYTKANIFNSISNLTNSIFIISGDHDYESKEITEQYQKYIPAIESVTIPDTRHLPHMENAKEFCEQINILFDIK